MKDEKIAMIGTGMMGMSLAVLFTGNGYDTTVLATKEASVLRGRNSYNEMYSVLPRYTSVSLFEHQMRQGWIWFRISKITCSRPRVTERRRLTLLTTGWPATAGDRKTVWEFTSGMQSPSPISRRGHLNLIGSISTGNFPKTEKVLPEI